MSEAPLLEMKGIHKRFPGVSALTDVSIALNAGEVLGLVGANGAGKSTLMKILGGAIPKDVGDIYIKGQLCHFPTPQSALAAGVAIIYQELSLLPDLSVAENIFLGRHPRLTPGIVNWKRLYAAAQEILDRLGVHIDPAAPVRELSLGHQQIVELAKALSLNAEIIVMDEPSASLSESEFRVLVRVIRDLRKAGRGIIYISHRLEEIFELADRVTILRDGRVVGTHPVSALDYDSLATMIVGREVKRNIARTATELEGPVVLEIKNLRGSRMKGINLRLHEGEILGLYGLVGSGRTETLRALFAADRAEWDSYTVFGQPARFRSPSDAIAAGLALVPEDRKTHGLVLIRPIWENTAMVYINQRLRRRPVRYGPLLSRVAEVTANLQVKASSLETVVGTLSGGNQQKVVLSKWLMDKPKIILLDEPTRGIDIGSKHEFYQQIRELRRSGISVIVASSEIDEVLQVADRVLVLYHGRVVGEYPPVEECKDEILHCALTGRGESNHEATGA